MNPRANERERGREGGKERGRWLPLSLSLRPFSLSHVSIDTASNARESVRGVESSQTTRESGERAQRALRDAVMVSWGRERERGE